MVEQPPPLGEDARDKKILKGPESADVSTGTFLTGTSAATKTRVLALSGSTESSTEIKYLEQKRLILEINPAYIRLLRDHHELGYERTSSIEKLELKTFDIQVENFRTAMSDVLGHALATRFLTRGIKHESEVLSKTREMVSLTADICMSALYAKLQNVYKAYASHTTRYSSAPSYTEEVEVPLPLALAIHEFGSFETQCLPTNYIYAPTYPEGTRNQGRGNAEYKLAEYESYIPMYRMLDVPLKSIDARVKTGSAWWTYQVKNIHHCSDLKMPLPPIHYSDHSAILRSCFLAVETNQNSLDILKIPDDSPSYGTRLTEAIPGFCIRSFLALCHGPVEEWSLGMS